MDLTVQEINDALDIAECCVSDEMRGKPEGEEIHRSLRKIRDMALRARAEGEPVAMDMALCEATRVVLREGQLYRFWREGECKECISLAAHSKDAYGPPLERNAYPSPSGMRLVPEESVMVPRKFLESARCPVCDGSGWITNTGPDPQHDGCEWCYERDMLLAAAPEAK